MLDSRDIIFDMAWDSGLVGPHLEIARYPGTPLRIMASPGTGKTFAMMRKVARLLETGTLPSNILIVSFTRTAANELIHSLNLLGAPGAEQVVARTLHSLSFSLLIKNLVLQATHRYPRPLIKYEEESLVADLAGQFGGKTATRDLIKAFEAYWARLQHQQPGWPVNHVEQAFDNELRHWLTYHEAMLIGELIPRALDYARQNPASADVPSYAHVLVDEYQDLNRADQDLIDIFARNGTLTVVGDEDQSIYASLRFAQPESITKFDLTHSNTHDEPLNECKRCPNKPIQMANSLILHNHPAIPSTICPKQGCPQGNVYIVQHGSIQEEVTNISAYIDWYLTNHPEVNPGNVLVLSPRRLIGYAIRDELIRLGRETRSYFNEECLETDSAQTGFCLLTLLNNLDDRPALRSWLGFGSNDWRSPAYKRIWQAAETAGISPKSFLEGVKSGVIQAPPHSTEILKKYDELMTALQTTTGLAVAPLIDILWLPSDSDCADIRAMALVLAETVDSPIELLAELSEVITQPELPADSDDVIRVMSLHKSKGLTANCVIVVGCVVGAVPTIKSGLSALDTAKAIEEQRRLFYVAITRTKETLVLSSSASAPYAQAMKMRFQVGHRIGSSVALQASPFLSELGPHAPTPQSGIQWRTSLGF